MNSRCSFHHHQEWRENLSLPEGVCGALVSLQRISKHHVSPPEHLVHEVDKRLCGVEAHKDFPASLHQPSTQTLRISLYTLLAIPSFYSLFICRVISCT